MGEEYKDPVREPKSREELLDRIIEIETRMFRSVWTSVPSGCQQNLQAFAVMRRMTHSALSDDTLISYLQDLLQAAAYGRNIMTEKYAYIDELIEHTTTDPLIDRITEIEQGWLDKMTSKYPNLYSSASREPSAHYLRCELKTLSQNTLELYFRDVYQALEEGRNLTEIRYTCLAELLGFISIEEWIEASI